MFDENSGVDHRTLTGHSGPVFGVCFSCDKNFLVSGSEDGTGNCGLIQFMSTYINIEWLLLVLI